MRVLDLADDSALFYLHHESVPFLAKGIQDMELYL
jgi:hypothetical protein